MLGFLSLLSLLPGFERELRLLPFLVRSGQVCVDIGASAGTYTVPLALLVGATGAVLAHEPREVAARRLRRTTRLLGLPQVHVEASAVGATPTTATLRVPRRRLPVPGRAFLADGGTDHRLEAGLRPGSSHRVPVVTLDGVRSAIGRPIDFVKCDVEGAEHGVLVGGTATFTLDRPVVLCEIEERHTRRYGRTADSVVAAFRDLDYQCLAGSTDDTSERNHLLVPTEKRSALAAALSGPTALAMR
jgi:FkbM family methyltransferase